MLTWAQNHGNDTIRISQLVPTCVFSLPGQWKLCSLSEVFLSPSPAPPIQGVGVSTRLMRAVGGAGRGRQALATCVSCD